MKKIKVEVSMNEDILFENGTDTIKFTIEKEEDPEAIINAIREKMLSEFNHEDAYIKKGKEYLVKWISDEILYNLKDRLVLNMDEEGDLNNEYLMGGNQTLNIEISDIKLKQKNTRNNKI